MRTYAVFIALIAMLAGIGFLLFTHPREAHKAPAEIIEASDAGGPDAASGAAADASIDAAGGPHIAKLLDRPLRVAVSGWELAAPGVRAADDTTPSALDVELAVTEAPAALEARLARGGADPQGADVGVMTLPSFVASYERLRALRPEIMLVVGWSRGREELRGARDATPTAPLPKPGDEVKLVTAGDDASTLVGLFGLDLLGFDAEKVRLVSPQSPDAKVAPFVAAEHGAAPDSTKKVLVTTADAARLVPIVAVASRGSVDAHRDAYVAWARAWLDGLARVRKDAPAAARSLAMKQGATFAAGADKAPEALALVERLGELDGADAASNADAFGLGAKSGATLDALVQRTWQLSRGAEVVTSPPLEHAPIDSDLVAALPHAAAGDAGVPRDDADAGVPAGSTQLILARFADARADDASMVMQVGFLGGVFERGVLRVGAKSADRSRAIAATARERFGLGARVVGGGNVPQGAAASIEILSPP